MMNMSGVMGRTISEIGRTDWRMNLWIKCYSIHILISSSISIQNFKCLWGICTELWAGKFRRTDWRTNWRTVVLNVICGTYLCLAVYPYKISNVYKAYIRTYGREKFGGRTDGLMDWLTDFGNNCYMQHIHMCSSISIQNFKCLWWIGPELWAGQIRMTDGRTDTLTDGPGDLKLQHTYTYG